MKHSLVICLIGLLFSFNSFGQVRQLPSAIDTNTVSPEEIPSPEKLKMMGASEEEVEKITEFKARKLAERTIIEQKQNIPGEKQRSTEKSTDSNVKNIDTPIVKDTSRETIFGHSFFKNNNIKFYDKANQLKAPDNYILGIGDEISIAIWGYSDFNGAFTIDEDGAINPKLVGRIYLKGLTFKDAKGLVAGKFKNVYDLNNSQIDITLTYSRVITVNIVGEVNNPGAFTIPAINTTFNALVTVGGIRTIGSVRKIYVKRGGQTIKTLDVYEYLMNPDSKQDFFLENNDYIFVPSSGRVVKINGQVKRPHGYELIEKENLESVINYAGGFDAGAYRKRIQIKRFSNNEETVIDVNYDSLAIAKKDFELLDGDEVLVRKIPEGYSNFVELIGPVKLPGNYEMKPGDRISDIIKRAEGVLHDVFDSRAYVIRLNPDFSKKYIPFNLKEVIENPNSPNNIKLQNLDIIKIFSKSYFKDEFVFSVIGAVRSPGDYTYGDGITLKDALYLAGGLKKEAAKNRIEISRAVDFVSSSGVLTPIRTIIKTIQVADDFKIDKTSEGFIIQPYDQILVRTEPNFELQQNIVLQGEVMYPGVYPLLNKNERVTDVIQRAGGFTQYAFPEGATLSRTEFETGFLFFKLQDVMKDSGSKYNYILRGGDAIIIPKVDQLIQISGLINYPDISTLKQISAPYTSGKSVRYYVKNYGLGFDKKADRKKAYVLEAGGYVKKTKTFLFIKFYPKVAKGAVVVVPQKIVNEKRQKKESEPINWNKQIEGFTIKLTGLATLWLIFTQLVK
ncbi:MAG: SLBB domain-containing protein [Bacteroidia bacterium]|nr:SLBB domain-containing protein [Bacteroidia bacterium]